MTYVVLARKWRPQRFEELTGQEHVARTLQNAITSERIPHAVLFTGPRGVGKTSSARILSMALNCENGPTPTPCGTCQACVEVKSGRSVDILEIDGASNRGINEIRELRDSVQYAPSRDRYKVYIIDEVHMLTTEAFNALLKTLEEPPPHVVFIFATTEPQKLPVTILSRCQRFDFREIGVSDIIGRLEHILSHEGINAEPDALRMIARQAAGGMRDALSLLDQVISSSDGDIRAEQTADLLGATDRRLLFELSEAVITRNAASALQTLQRALRRGADTSWLAGEFASHMRDLTVLAVAGPHADLTILSEDELETAHQQVQRSDSATLEVLLDLILNAAEQIAGSSMGTLRFELALIRMCEVPSRQRIDRLIAMLEAQAGIEQPLTSAAPPAATTSAPAPSTSHTLPPTSSLAAQRSEAPTADFVATKRKPTTSKAASPTTDLATPEPEPAAEPSVDTIEPEPVATQHSTKPTSVASKPVEPEPVEPEPVPPEPIAISAEASAPATPATKETLTAAPPPKADPPQCGNETPSTTPTSTVEPDAPTADVQGESLSDTRQHTSSSAEAVQEAVTDEPSAPATDDVHSTHDTSGSEAVDAPTAPSTPAGHGVLREPTLATWREAVTRLDGPLRFARRMLAMSYCLAEDGVFRVAALDTYVKERDHLQEVFGEISQELFGRPWTLNIVEDTILSDAERARAWVIRNKEEEEEEALREKIQARIAQTPLIQSVKKRWPEYELGREQIEFMRLDEYATDEEEDDL